LGFCVWRRNLIAASRWRTKFDGKARSAKAVGSIADCLEPGMKGQPPSGDWEPMSLWRQASRRFGAVRTRCVLGEDREIVKSPEKTQKEAGENVSHER